MPGIEVTVDALDERFPVYRVGNDQPITLLLPYRTTMYGSTLEVGTLDQFIQVDIDQTVEPPEIKAFSIEAIPVSTKKSVSIPSKLQMDYFASCALSDLGIFHPGISDLLNFAEDYTG